MIMVTETLRHTPVWVYFIFVYLLYVGIRSMKARVMSVKRIVIMPLVFIIWSGVSMALSGRFETVIVGWIALLPFGMLAGYIQTRRFDIQVNRKLGRIKIPGTISTLVIIALTFSFKYFAGFMNAVYPDIANGNVFQPTIFAVSGFFTGIFVGRMILYLHRFNTSAESDVIA